MAKWSKKNWYGDSEIRKAEAEKDTGSPRRERKTFRRANWLKKAGKKK